MDKPFQLFGDKAWNTSLEPVDLPVAPAYDEVKELVIGLGWKWFDQPFDLNFGAFRQDEGDDVQFEGDILNIRANTFDDVGYLAWTDYDGNQYIKLWKWTCDPGEYWRQRPGRGKTETGITRGVGAIREGQHLQVYYPGMHGDRPALQQEQNAVIVYRDNNIEDLLLSLDPSKTANGWGFRIHYMGKFLEFVNRWSGGCNGSNDPGAVPFILAMVQRQEDAGHGNKLSFCMLRVSWVKRGAEYAKKEFDHIDSFEVGKGI